MCWVSRDTRGLVTIRARKNTDLWPTSWPQIVKGVSRTTSTVAQQGHKKKIGIICYGDNRSLKDIWSDPNPPNSTSSRSNPVPQSLTNML